MEEIIRTDTVRLSTPLSVMYPTKSNTDRAREPRIIDYAIKEFSSGVQRLAEIGKSSDLSELMERFTLAMVSQSDAHARATVRPKVPTWIVSVVVGLTVAFMVGGVSALETYGALQNRVGNLESRTSNIDRLNSLDTKVDFLINAETELEKRFNDLIAVQARRDK